MKLATRLALTAAIIAAFLMVFVLSVQAQDKPLEPPSVVTDGLANGYAWQLWDSHAHLAFTKGFMEGVALIIGALDDKVLPKYFYPKTEGELETAITEFYKDPQNAKIPILAVYMYETARENGATPKDLEDRLNYLRRKANTKEGELQI
jgi:hypothetical protein